MVYSHIIIIMSPSNYSSMILLGVGCPKWFDRTAHLVYMLITLRALPLDYLSGKLRKPVLLSHKLLIYTSDLRVVSSTLIEQHNISLWQTLQNNRISSWFSHITIWKVLLPPFIQYHIDSVSTSVVIYNIYFSVGISNNIYLLVLNLHPLSLRSKARLTSYSIRRLGRPCGARTSHHVISPAADQATHCGLRTRGP